MGRARIDRFRERYGPWALVAGGSDGIGAAFARRLAENRLNLLLVGRRVDALESLAGELAERHAVQTRTASLDLSRCDDVTALLEQTRELDIGLAVCNAAMSVIGPFFGQAIESHDRMLDLNCRAPLHLTHGIGLRMIARRRGGIVLLSSMASLAGTLLSAHYAATKAYLRVLAEGLWVELRPDGIDVVASCPGTVRTPTFLRDDPVSRPLVTLPVMESGPTVAQTLRALGRRPVVVPGRIDRVFSFLMERLLPRKMLITLTAKATRAMYPHLATRQAARREEEQSTPDRD